jgi:hypothetical protein
MRGIGKYLRAILYHTISILAETIGNAWVNGGVIRKTLLMPLFLISLAVMGFIGWMHDGDKSEDIL